MPNLPDADQTASFHPSREQLAGFFAPRNVALVGASDRSSWSHSIFARFSEYGHQGQLYAVNRDGKPAHGLPGYARVADIPEPVETAFIFVPAPAVAGALRESAEAGVRNVVVLSSGFAEAGDEGRTRQDELTRVAAEAGVAMLGPNSLGFANFGADAYCTSIRSRLPVRKGGLAIVSQSGAVTFELAKWAHAQGIGLSFLCATGNEAQLGVADVIDALVDDPATRAIAVYVEGVFAPSRFAAAIARARVARKPVVLLKIGRSAVSSAVAQAHTGAMVGDDGVFDALCRRYGVTRVSSLEELITTAEFLGRVGPISPPRVTMASVSGGACAMYADLAEQHGLAIAPLAAETQAQLRTVLPSFAATLNPLDATGVVTQDVTLWERVIPPLVADPGAGLLVIGYNIPNTAEERRNLDPTFAAIASGYRAAGAQPVIVSFSVQDQDETQAALRAELGLDVVLPNLELGVRALAHLQRWSERLLEPDLPAAPQQAEELAPLRGERGVLDHLARHGVPVVPGVIVANAQEAVAAAQRLELPVALKIASVDIAHKTEVGGVQLGLADAEAVAAAHDAILASVRRHRPDARIDGVIVSPMRDPGLELIVGLARDPQWGPALIVGLGGVLAEVLGDTALELLPVTAAKARAMLERLRGAALFAGYRGSPAADIEALSHAVAAIGDAALALGPKLAALEVNPLRVRGSEIECLDALAIYAD